MDHEGHHVCRGGEGLILDLGLKRGTHLPISGQLCHQHTKVIAGLNAPQIRSHPAAADRRVPNEILPLFKPRHHSHVSPHRNVVLAEGEVRVKGLPFRLEERGGRFNSERFAFLAHDRRERILGVVERDVQPVCRHAVGQAGGVGFQEHAHRCCLASYT